MDTAVNEPKPSTYVRKINGQAELNSLMQSCKLICIYFHALWCPPCRQLTPILQGEANRTQQFALACVNIDNTQNLSLVTKYHVSSLPSVFLWDQSTNKVVNQFTGFKNQKLKELLDVVNKTSVVSRPEQKASRTEKLCSRGHPLQLCTFLPMPYKDSIFWCDICRAQGVASQIRPMLNCHLCRYDLCYDCANS